ncbi:hypothetical protein YQE_02598, partial [Dendroctonus ponderosae]
MPKKPRRALRELNVATSAKAMEAMEVLEVLAAWEAMEAWAATAATVVVYLSTQRLQPLPCLYPNRLPCLLSREHGRASACSTRRASDPGGGRTSHQGIVKVPVPVKVAVPVRNYEGWSGVYGGLSSSYGS